VELRRIHLVAIAAAVFVLLVVQIALAGNAANPDGPQAATSASVTTQIKKLKRRVAALEAQAGQPGPQGQTGAPGSPGQDATAPTGAVTFFNLAACPAGWTELTAARGRYLVGLPAGGTLTGTAGTALTNLQDRAVGLHSHAVTDPGHTHAYLPVVGDTDNAAGSAFDRATTTATQFSHITSGATTGITVNPTGVAGTNAPYLQLLVCQKD